MFEEFAIGNWRNSVMELIIPRPLKLEHEESHLLQNRLLIADTIGIKLDSDRPRVEIVQPYFDFKRMLLGAGRNIDCSETQAAPVVIQRMLPSTTCRPSALPFAVRA